MNSKATINEKTPPHNLDAEKSILGSMMIAQGEDLDAVMTTVSGDLASTDLYAGRNQSIFSAVQELYDGGARGIDIVTLGATNSTNKRGWKRAAGAPTYWN